MTDKIKLKNGISISHGQLFIPATSPLHPRNGAKHAKAKTVPLAYGAVHQGADRKTLSAYHHGIPLCDEKNIPLKFHGQVPIHAGMSADQVAKMPPVGTASAILREAGRLGAPVGGYKK